MKKISIRLSMFCILFFVTITVFSEVSLAANDDNNLGYLVSTVKPNSQIDPEKSYFYLQTVPGQEQTLEVKVKSTRKEPVKLNIFSTDAITGEGGTIEYADSDAKKDESLHDPVSSLIQIETPTLTIENFEEKIVKFRLTPPKKTYDGVKMGALVFAINDNKNKSGVSTQFSYRIGVILSESGDEFNNSQKLFLKDVKASIKRGKKMVLANLQNSEPKIMENLEIIATVKKSGSDEVVKKKSVNNYSMAPNSNFDFEMDWGIEQLPSGVYTLSMDAKNDFYDWHFSKEFKISNAQAKKINNESEFKLVTPTWVKIITIVLFIVTGTIIMILLVRRRRWENRWKDLKIMKRKNKKRKQSRNARMESW